VPAERKQPRLVALDESLEGAVVAAPREGDQPLVTLETKKRRPSRKSR
jgi:hypothetical protein